MYKITNIILEGERLRVYASFNGNDEDNVFPPEATVEDILNWAKDRKAFYEGLKIKEIELQKELVGIEL